MGPGMQRDGDERAVSATARGPWPASLPDDAGLPPRPTTFEEAVSGEYAAHDWLEEAVDWSRLALRLRTVLADDPDQTLEVHAGSLPPLVIDLAQRAYWWEVDLADFPQRVATLSIVPRDPVMQRIQGPGWDVDPLLWRIAHSSFDDALAPWLHRTDRYQLRRWPNLTALPHESHHLRAISTLGQAALTPTEFAAVTELDPSEAHRLLTTFSLMDLLRVLPQEGTAARLVVPKPKTHGLFGRLLSLFGR